MKVLSKENFACNVRWDGQVVNAVFNIGENEFDEHLWALLAEKTLIKTLLGTQKLVLVPAPPAASLPVAEGGAPLLTPSVSAPSLTPETKRQKRRRK